MAAPQGYGLWFIHVSLPSMWSKFSPIGEWASGKWMNKWTTVVFMFSNIFEHDVFIICLITQYCPVCKLLQTLWTIEGFDGIKDRRIEAVIVWEYECCICIWIWMLCKRKRYCFLCAVLSHSVMSNSLQSHGL